MYENMLMIGNFLLHRNVHTIVEMYYVQVTWLHANSHRAHEPHLIPIPWGIGAGGASSMLLSCNGSVTWFKGCCKWLMF
jgi:hypothetical protein